jgi:hypothetical protein
MEPSMVVRSVPILTQPPTCIMRRRRRKRQEKGGPGRERAAWVLHTDRPTGEREPEARGRSRPAENLSRDPLQEGPCAVVANYSGFLIKHPDRPPILAVFLQ